MLRKILWIVCIRNRNQPSGIYIYMLSFFLGTSKPHPLKMFNDFI